MKLVHGKAEKKPDGMGKWHKYGASVVSLSFFNFKLNQTVLLKLVNLLLFLFTGRGKICAFW